MDISGYSDVWAMRLQRRSWQWKQCGKVFGPSSDHCQNIIKNVDLNKNTLSFLSFFPIPATRQPAIMSSYPAKTGAAGLSDYPYPPSQYDPSTVTSSTFSATKVGHEDERMARTPSPTPSELKELEKGAIDWKALATWRFWLRRDWLCESFSIRTHSLAEPSDRVLCHIFRRCCCLNASHHLPHPNRSLAHTCCDLAA